MYRYEDLMLDDLLEDPSFDEDDPEVLYALARCYLEGKGVAADEAIYRKFLKKAAEAGSKTARLELEAAAPAQPDEPKEAGDACLDEAALCRTKGDISGEIAALERAWATPGRYSPEQAQAINLRLGELYSQPGPWEAPERSYASYCTAVEMGSSVAPLRCADCLRRGYGCTASESDSRAMILLAAQRGPARLKYDTALDILDSTPGEALLLLDKAQEELESDGGNEPLLRRVRLHLAALKNGGCLPEEMVAAALAETEDPSVTSLLLATFTRQPRLITQAVSPFVSRMARQPGKDQPGWLNLAADLGDAYAREELKRRNMADFARIIREEPQAEPLPPETDAAGPAPQPGPAWPGPPTLTPEQAARRKQQDRIARRISVVLAVLFVAFIFLGPTVTRLFSSEQMPDMLNSLSANNTTLARRTTYSYDEDTFAQKQGGTFNTGESYDSALYASTSYSAVEYQLEGKYDTLTGRWGIDSNFINTTCQSSFSVYADGRCVYESPVITGGSAPCDVEVDVTGCNLLTIIFQGADGSARFADAELENRSGVKTPADALPELAPGAWLSGMNLMQGDFYSGDSGHSVSTSIYSYDSAETFATFYLGGEYESLSAVLEVSASAPMYLEVYGDDELLASSEPMANGSVPFSADLKGCQQLTVRFCLSDSDAAAYGGSITLAGARLSRNPL